MKLAELQAEALALWPNEAEVRQILAFFTGVPALEIVLNPEREISAGFCEKIRIACLQRADLQFPLQYIFGAAPFRNLNVSVNEHVLIPRPETEQLVTHVLSFLKNKRAPRVLDLCCGSGCIALAIASECASSSVTALDCSSDALALAERNAAQCSISSVHFVSSDLFEKLPLDAPFDCIVSNPPYVSPAEYEALPFEVKNYEPKLALWADDDGFALVEKIIEQAPRYLKEDGALFLEMGEHHQSRAFQALEKAGFASIHMRDDLAGRPRFVCAYRV